MSTAEMDAMRDPMGNLVFIISGVRFNALKALSELLYTGTTTVESNSKEDLLTLLCTEFEQAFSPSVGEEAIDAEELIEIEQQQQNTASDIATNTMELPVENDLLQQAVPRTDERNVRLVFDLTQDMVSPDIEKKSDFVQNWRAVDPRDIDLPSDNETVENVDPNKKCKTLNGKKYQISDSDLNGFIHLKDISKAEKKKPSCTDGRKTASDQMRADVKNKENPDSHRDKKARESGITVLDPDIEKKSDNASNWKVVEKRVMDLIKQNDIVVGTKNKRKGNNSRRHQLPDLDEFDKIEDKDKTLNILSTADLDVSDKVTADIQNTENPDGHLAKRARKSYTAVSKQAGKFSCKGCNYSTKYKDTLRFHKCDFDTNRHFVCNMCTISFKTKLNLMRHKAQIHSKDKPYYCTTCYKTFKTKSGLTQHQEKCVPYSMSHIPCQDEL